MKRLLKYYSSLTILLTLISLTANAQQTPVVFHLNKGDAAPTEGFLFTPGYTRTLQQAVLDSNTYKLMNTSLQASLDQEKSIADLQSQKVSLLLDQDQKLAATINDARSSSELTKIIFFTLGVLATGIAVYGASHLITK